MESWKTMTLIASVLVLIIVHSMFVAAEFATVQMARIDRVRPNQPDRSCRTLLIRMDLEEYLMVCQLGKVTAQLVLGMAIGWSFGTQLWQFNLIETPQLLSIGLYFLGLCSLLILQMVVGYELPKRAAIEQPERYSELLNAHLILSHMLFWPLIRLIKIGKVKSRSNR